MVAVLIVSFYLSGCGAQLDSASDVNGLFIVAPKSLGAMAAEICRDIASRHAAPTTQVFSLFRVGDCKDSGVRALGLNGARDFIFTDEVSGQFMKENGERVFSKSVRSQIWLNRTIAELIPQFASMLKGAPLPKKGEIKLPSSVANFEGLIKPVISLVDDPKFKLDDMSVGVPFHVKTSGVVSIDLDILINAKIYGNGVAVTIKTGEQEPSFKESLLKSVEAFVYVIPYADDIYIDMAAGFKMYDIGGGNLIDKQLNTIAGSGLKSILDSIMKIGGQS